VVLMRSLLLTFALATAAAFGPHAQARRHRTCQASVSKPAVVRVAESPAMFGGGKSATPRVAKKVVKKPVAKKVVKKVVAKRVVKKVVAKRVVKKVVAKRVVKKVVAKQVVKKVVPKKVVKKIVKRVVAKKAVQTKVAKPSDNFFVNFFKPKSLKSSQPAATGAQAAGAAKLKKVNDERKKAIARAVAEKRKKSPKLALQSRAEAVKKERVAREKQLAATRMAASKATYNAKMKVKQDQFKLNQKISKNFVAGKTTRL